MAKTELSPDYLFETSWEVCNKVGGIHTVVSTKALTLSEELGDKLILIGPDVWRDDEKNPEFEEDTELFKVWREKAAQEGLIVQIGRWKIAGKPVAIIVDFTSFINKKDEIFSSFWETYKLDSLSGQWDYIEPALFGYASAKVIESFVKFNLSSTDKVVAQFHEWMTGTGVLYLNQSMPQVATAFTTHATAIGRSIAGNNLPLYKNIENYNAENLAREFNIISKQSLERLSGQVADAFTTVSDITSKECKYFLKKEVDIVTPNGFEDLFVPPPDKFDGMRKAAREKFITVAENQLGYSLPQDIILVATSGRYEFKNKGIDLYIDALGELNRSNVSKKEVLAFVLVPANHFGPRPDLVEKLSGNKNITVADKFLTHNLHDADYDPTLNRIKKNGLTNSKEDKVKIIFVPSYLNGNDGIFNMPYYDLLIGLDLTVFASYYEPWGYTPLESLAFRVPTITTELAGFGMWVLEEYPECGHGICVIHRTDDNDESVSKNIFKSIVEYSKLTDDEVAIAKDRAFLISRTALWKNLVKYYKTAYNIALQKVESRKELFYEIEQTRPEMQVIRRTPISEPLWSELIVRSNLTEKLKRLNELARNLWWCWNTEAIELFEQIDPKIWQDVKQNPISLLENVELKRFLAVEKDSEYINKKNRVLAEFDAYMADKKNTSTPKIAYFSMEFGLHPSLQVYSGGLGILAGDYLKEASDMNVDMVGVGLFYKFGYFKQVLSVNGEQQAVYEPQVLSHIPVEQVNDKNGNWLTIQLVLPGRTMYARVWKANVGRIPLYLLDTDFEANSPQDRFVTHNLYGGDNENRLKQELLLGIGGIRILEAVGIQADIYHSNEGHSAFNGLERLRILLKDQNLSFEVAKEVVRASSIFTTHTPVPAGHDFFPEDLLRVYIAHYPERLKISWDELMGLGRFNPFNHHEKFSMSVLAANLAQEMNGVSMLHGKVSQDMFNGLWNGYLPEENHIGYVTNGVHFGTWTAKEWKSLYFKTFPENFIANQSDPAFWKKIQDVPDEDIWDIKQTLKNKLFRHIKQRLTTSLKNRAENPRDLVEIIDSFDEDALTIGFARRFATYKRADLLFRNPDRLDEIINNPDAPVQFLFAGKAHPHDGGGQDLIKRIVALSKEPRFKGKILFLQNYDIALAQKLVSGVDIWLNTPTRPLEASGTSGEKAVMNGVMHFSVLDGWWVEGYKEGAGWALPLERTYENQDYQNELDAETIYNILENEIIPAYYDRDKNGIPHNWVSYIKNTISEVAPHFTMQRMMKDYFNRYYNKLYERKNRLINEDFKIAKDIALWKKMVSRKWDSLEVVSISLPKDLKEGIVLGKEYYSEVVLDLKGFLTDEVGIEFLIVNQPGITPQLVYKQEYEYTKDIEGKALYKLTLTPNQPGSFRFGVRLFPKHNELPHRQDVGFVKWI